MSEIFKVIHLNGENIERVFVFFGKPELNDGDNDVDPYQLYSLEPDNPVFNNVFNETEKNEIEKHKIPLEFIPYKIHIDDSIDDIKRKIILTFQKKISFGEIYLFTTQKKKFNPVKIYQALTQDNKEDLTNKILIQFLLNFKTIDIKDIEDKPIYSFEDILNINFNDEHIIKKPLGQYFMRNNGRYQYTSNPYDALVYDDFLEEQADNIVSTRNSNLLLDFGKIVDNTIYLTLAKEVFTYSENNPRLTKFPKSTCKIYFPFLFKKDITTEREITINHEKLLSENNGLLGSVTLDKMKNIDLFYKMWDNFNSPLNYISRGITEIEFNLQPDVTFKMPLDIIFKLINSSKTIPFIKYNPGNRKEKVYRLFSEETSTDGRKIPFLNKAKIFKLIKIIGHKQTVALYIETEYEDHILSITCEFGDTGNIHIFSKFPIPLSIDAYSNVIREQVNPIIDVVKRYMEQNGYSINRFENLFSNEIEIINIKYISYLPITKKINLSKFSGCVSSIFNVTNDDNLKSGITMRFKRVANFNIMNSKEASIIELTNKGYSTNDVITSLMQNYDLSNEEASKNVLQFLSEVQVERGLNENKKHKIKEHPGFLTIIKSDSFQSNITISVENIDNIRYLETIPIYIDSLIRITEGKYPPDIKLQANKLCKKKKIDKKETTIVDIIDPIEKKIMATELKFGENNSDDGDEDIPDYLLSDYEDEDDDDDDDGNQVNIGGASYGEDISLGNSIGNASPSPSPEGDISLGNSIGIASPSPEGEDTSLGNSIGIASPSPEGDTSLGNNIGIASPSPAMMTNKLPISIPGQMEIVNESKINSSEEPPASKEEEDPPASKEEEEAEEEPPASEESEVSEKSVESVEEEEEGEESEEEEEGEESVEEEEGEESVEEEEEPVQLNSIGEDEPPEKKSSLSPMESDSDDEETLTRDITGMPLANPNYFFDRMEKRDPTLFLKQKQGKFNAYSRMCQSNYRRQPVIVTKEELDKIDKEHPGSYDKVIKYGSNRKKQFYYMCPRYWCLTENTSLTEEEVNAGACGGRDAIIPFGAKKVPKGKTIFEFSEDLKHKNEDGSYIKHYPGFLSGNKHPDGYCMPCCFKSWDAPQQVERRNQCQTEETEKESNSPEELMRVASNEMEEYIMGSEKFPLEQNKWGYLPLSIQIFMKTDNKKCQISTSEPNKLKSGATCFLRRGVEINKYQSFIACIADLYTDDPKWVNEHAPNINEMKQIIKDSLTIDNFVTYQNGNLITLFYDENREVYIDKYSESDLFDKINTQESVEVEFLEKVISSFESFLVFLDKDDIIIDYKYLWDIICKKNNKLFAEGLNLIIIEITDDDNTDNVELICPTNHYVDNYYDPRKNSLILIKKGEYFEPVYKYIYIKDATNTDRYLSSKIFTEKKKENKKFNIFTQNVHLPPNIKEMLNQIKDYTNNNCGSLPSLPKMYNFERSILLNELIDEIKHINGKILYFVSNFNGKIIGIKIVLGKMDGFLPCYPSNLRLDRKNKLDNFKFINDPNIWSSFKDTIRFCESVKKKSKKIPCGIKLKVIEDGLVIGFLTETNQFLQISTPVENIDDDIPFINDSNYLIADSEIIFNKKVDNERIEYIKKINLDKNFYNVFRNSVRITLNNFENINIRNEILEIINSPHLLYYDKLRETIKRLHLLVDDFVDFYSYKMDDLLKIEQIGTCINSDCDSEWCLKQDSGLCKIMLPKNSLISKKDNEKVYFGKIADELVRYNRIKHFIFDPKVYLSFTEVKYNIHDNEIILLQSLITQEYFNNLIPALTNNFIKTNTYDSTKPSLTQTYSNYVSGKLKKPIENVCSIKSKNITGKWSKFLPKDFKEREYGKSAICTFDLIQTLIKLTDQELSITTIKNKLITLYEKYIEMYGESKILSIMKQQGKWDLWWKIKSKESTIDHLIMNEEYYLTNFDLWILSLEYKIPVIFISSTKLHENNKNLLTTFNENPTFYIIIKCPRMEKDKIPKYKLILGETDNILINSMPLLKLNKMILSTRNIDGYGVNIHKFVEDFKPVEYKPKKKVKRILKIVENSPKISPNKSTKKKRPKINQNKTR